MSSVSDAAGLVPLTVISPDEGTEIYVVDGQMQLVASGRRELRTSLPPGIYKIRVLTGGTTHEELVALRESTVEVTVSLPALSFASAVPLNNTANSHEYHQDLAQRVSASGFPILPGQSGIFIMGRVWSATSTGAPTPPAKAMELGLQLLHPDGTPVADLEKLAEFHTAGDPAAACVLRVPPGKYLLARKLPSGDSVVRTIVASPGWQTQVFLMDCVGKDQGRLIHDADTAVLLAQKPFDPADPQLRLDEIARRALTDVRQPLSEDGTRSILYGKYENPILGILGAHLLLAKKSTESKPPAQMPGRADLPEWQQQRRQETAESTERLRLEIQNLFPTVVANLRRLLGDQHPDVEALALVLPDRKSSYQFDCPPMLRASWALVLDASVDRPEIVPEGCLTDRAASHLLTEQPWLLWVASVEPVAAAAPHPEDDALSFGVPFERAPAAPVEPSIVEEALRNYLRPRGRSRGVSRGSSGLESVTFSVPGGGSETLPIEADMRRLVRTLGVPRQRVERMIKEAGAAGASGGVEGPKEPGDRGPAGARSSDRG